MSMQELLHRNRDKAARVAGLLYLIVVVAGMFSLAYVPSQLGLSGDAAATLGKLEAGESLLRLGIAASIVCYTSFLLLPLALYRLLGETGRVPAVLMVAFATASVPLSFANLLNRLDTLSLLESPGLLQALDSSQRSAQAMLSLEAYGNGILLSEIFWGLWLLPFGYLVFKSGFLPRLLGVLLLAGGFGYLADVFGNLLVPGYPSSPLAGLVRLPAAVGEIGSGLWLLVMGARPMFGGRRVDAAEASSNGYADNRKGRPAP